MKTSRHSSSSFSGSLLLVFLIGVLSSLPARAAPSPDAWRMQGHDAQRTGRSSAVGPLAPHVKWTYDFTARVGDNVSPLVGPDGTIYQNTQGGFRSLYALRSDGTRKWFASVGGQTPALSADGTVLYNSGNDQNMPMNYFIDALDTQQVDTFTAIAAGGDHALAVASDGTVWAWGRNDYGQLGKGTSSSTYPVSGQYPVRAGALVGVQAVAAGYFHSLALKSDGTVWAWGHNDDGQLGDGTNSDRLSPVQVSGLTEVRAVAARMIDFAYPAGPEFSLALKQDGSVWMWGQPNVAGVAASTVPTQIATLPGATAIAAGDGHILVLAGNGTVWAWGANTYGQLGNANPATQLVLTQVSGLTGVTAIAAGTDDSFALKSDGTIWAWGYNSYGQLGDGTTTNQSTPVQVVGPGGTGTLTGTVSIAAGTDHTLAVRQDGSVWNWGSGGHGELGNGTYTYSNSIPIQVLGYNGVGLLSGASVVAGGNWHSLALASDGSISAWGEGSYGQIGPETPPATATPVEVIRQRMIWQASVGQGSSSYSSLTVGADGQVYKGTWEPALYAVNADGSSHWRYSSGSICGIESSPAVAPDGSIYFNHNCLGMIALNADGSERWRDGRVGGGYGWPTPAIDPDGTVYVHATIAVAFHPDGSVKWQRDDLNAANYFHGVAISADGQTIYTAISGGHVYALDAATGATRWDSIIAPTSEAFGGSPALSGNGILYIMGSGDQIYAVSAADGALLWQYQLNSGASFYWGPTSPAIGPDGTLYVVTAGVNGPWGKPNPPARLYAFGPADVCPAITLDAAALPDGTQGAAYSHTFSASGGTGPYIFAQTSGTKPISTTLAAGGVLGGAPTTSGSYSFTVTAADANGCTGSQVFALTIQPQPTATNIPTNTPTNTPTFTNTPTNTPTFTNTPTNSPTFTNTPTNSPTFTNTPTDTPTSTNTPTDTPTFTNTPTSTPTDTPTSTPTFTNTPTNTPTFTNTPTNTPTSTPTFTNTPTNTPTDTPTFTNTPTPTPKLPSYTITSQNDPLRLAFGQDSLLDTVPSSIRFVDCIVGSCTWEWSSYLGNDIPGNGSSTVVTWSGYSFIGNSPTLSLELHHGSSTKILATVPSTTQEWPEVVASAGDILTARITINGSGTLHLFTCDSQDCSPSYITISSRNPLTSTPTDTPTGTVPTPTATPTDTPTGTVPTTMPSSTPMLLTDTPTATPTDTPTGTVPTPTSTPMLLTATSTDTPMPTSTTVSPTGTPTAPPAHVDASIGQTYQVAGSDLTLRITTGNNGPDDLVGAIVDDPLPEPAPGTIWTWTCTATGGADCGTSVASTANQITRREALTEIITGTGNIRQRLGHLPVGGSVVFTVTGSLNNVNQWSNTPLLILPSGAVNKNGAQPSAPTVGHFQVMLPLIWR